MTTLISPKASYHFLSFSAFAENSDNPLVQPAQQKHQRREPLSAHESFNSLPARPALPFSNISTNTNAEQPNPHTSESLSAPPKLRRISQSISPKAKALQKEEALPEELQDIVRQFQEFLIKNGANPHTASLEKRYDWCSAEKKFFTEVYDLFDQLNKDIEKNSDYKKIENIQEDIYSAISYFLRKNPNFMNKPFQSIRNWNEFLSKLNNVFNAAHREYLNLAIPILEYLFIEYISKLENQSQSHTDKYIIKNIKEYISNLEAISSKLISSIDPFIYAEISKDENTTSYLIEYKKYLEHNIKQGKYDKPGHDKNTQTIRNYINWLDKVFAEHFKILFKVPSDYMDLSKIMAFAKNSLKPPYKYIADHTWKNIIIDIKNRTFKTLDIKELDDNEKIINNYLELEFKHYENSPRIIIEPRQIKDHKKNIENLKQALHNIEFMRGLPYGFFLDQINKAKKETMAKTGAETLAKVKAREISILKEKRLQHLLHLREIWNGQ